MNDSKYGYDCRDGVLRLTLLKSGIDPNPVTDKEVHSFTYSVYPHKDTWKKGKTQQMARMLNVPLIARLEGAHSGNLGDAYSFASLDKENVMLEVIKKAEDNDDIIVRLYEYQNERCETAVTLNDSFSLIQECDLLENPIQKAGEKTNRFSFTIKPYEIKTFRLKK